MQQLISTSSRVQAPYITVTIGDVSFGLYNKTKAHLEAFGKYYNAIKVTYPNYLQSLTVKKVNGALNTYTLVIVYAITERDDPNLIDKILSKVSKSRKIVFTYGDATLPNYMYREEEALITNVSTSPDVMSSKITYTITAVSGAVKSNSRRVDRERKLHTKPSDEIKKLLQNKASGLVEIFYGMHDMGVVLQKGLIASDDAPVDIMPKEEITDFEYIQYLVSCMVPKGDDINTSIRSARYSLVVHDDISDVLDGPYFTVEKMVTSVQGKTSVDTYEIDIGYPTKDYVSRFSINDNQTYSILYDYSNEISFSDYIYMIGDNGDLQEVKSPTVSKSSTYHESTISNRNWWSNMTQFPIRASMDIRGLLRAMLLMTYIKVNIYYYGKKHITSGIYCVTGQTDTINTGGYFTTLDLVRIAGDDNT